MVQIRRLWGNTGCERGDRALLARGVNKVVVEVERQQRLRQLREPDLVREGGLISEHGPDLIGEHGLV